MKRKKKITTAWIAAALLAAAAGAQTPSCEVDTLYNCFLMRAPYGLINQIAQRNNVTILGEVSPGRPDLVKVMGPASELPPAVLAQLQSDPDVVEAEEVVVAFLSEDAIIDGAPSGSIASLNQSGIYSGPESTYFGTTLWNGYADQPALDQISLDATHALSHLEAQGVGQVIAAIDTGVDPEHPVLQGSLLTGWDFIKNAPGASEWDALNPATRDATQQNLQSAADQSYSVIVEGGGTTDTTYSSTQPIVDQSYSVIVESESLPPGFGHGTMVAGILRLMAPGAMILPIRAFNGQGKASIADIIAAIYYAEGAGATVINMSFSVNGHSNELLRALKTAKKAKIVTVSSVGNEGSSGLTYPAAYLETFGAASIDSQGQLSSFSNFGPDTVAVSAPGEGIVTTFPGGLYAGAWGTSFSAAFLSGTAALLHKIMTTGETQRITYVKAFGALQESATQLDPANPDERLGSGILDTYGAFGMGLVGY